MIPTVAEAGSFAALGDGRSAANPRKESIGIKVLRKLQIDQVGIANPALTGLSGTRTRTQNRRQIILVQIPKLLVDEVTARDRSVSVDAKDVLSRLAGLSLAAMTNQL